MSNLDSVTVRKVCQLVRSYGPPPVLATAIHGPGSDSARPPCRLFFIKRRNNCYCLRSRGRSVARSRAGAPGGNRVALYSVESPRRSLALDPEPAGCWEATAHTQTCACVRTCLHTGVCVCVCALCIFFLPHQSPSTPTHQLAVTESSMKCLGSDRIRQPVSLASAASLSEGKQSAVLVNCDALLTSPNRSPEGESLPGWQTISWLCWNRSPGCVQSLKNPEEIQSVVLFLFVWFWHLTPSELVRPPALLPCMGNKVVETLTKQGTQRPQS